ncbi:MAG: FtsX-like permease family protein [Lachnospiraceae bacterium]|nr:FtsX-like permease family protein [Lachnospiraceae bacterium]
MKKAIITDFFREIHKSRRKFLSLFALSGLAVAFLSGLRATKPDMWYSADKYYKETNLFDIRVISTLGLTDEDVLAFETLDLIDEVEAVNTIDVLTEGFTVTLLSEPGDINKLNLVKGRLPKESGECVTEQTFLDETGLSVGDSFEVDLADQEDILKSHTYTIVGVAENPLYVSLIRGSSGIGTGTVSAWVCIPAEDFDVDYYTGIYMTLVDTDNLYAYEEPYDTYMEDSVDEIEPFAEERLKIRHKEIVDEATEKLNDAKDEYNEAKAEVEKELADAKAELDDALSEIEENEKKLVDAKNTIDSNESKLAEAKAKLDSSEETLNEAKTNLDALALQIQSIPDGAYGDTKAMLIAQYDAGMASYSAGLSEYEAGLSSYNAGKSELNSAKTAYDEGLTELEDGKAEYEDGLKEYNDAKEEAEEELAEAKEEIDEAEKEISEIEEGDIYVLDRNSNIGYVGFGQDSERMGNLAQVFPIIFFLVAALSCLTTVTRMIEEQRTEIGTLKALGYGKFSISIKYIGYAAMASFLGGVAGAIIGTIGIPYFIYTAWMIMYYFPPISYREQWDIVIPAILTSMGALSVTATLACLGTLLDTPANLMRPKAPKPGKRIWLEHIAFIWKKMHFTHKIAARNLFRYHQRFWMTVVGIAGCTGLLVTGFGLHDSIYDILDKQFEEINPYDASIGLAEGISDSNVEAIMNELDENDAVSDYAFFYQGTSDTYSDSSVVESVYLMPVTNLRSFETFFTLRHRKDDVTVSLDDDGALINEKLADELGVEPGDSVEITLDDDRRATITIADTFENYVYHYIFMTDVYYEKTVGESVPDSNLVMMNLTDDADQDRLSSKLVSMEDVSVYTNVEEIVSRFTDSFNSVNYAVMIIIGSAAALAFIVLYNLMNINITERTRELATLKVLGFTDGETAAYTYRENMVMTAIGIVAGMVFGKYLHGWLIATIEINQVMFGRDVHNESYIKAAVLTVVFALTVNVFAYLAIKTIDMVESLKSAE